MKNGVPEVHGSSDDIDELQTIIMSRTEANKIIDLLEEEEFAPLAVALDFAGGEKPERRFVLIYVEPVK